MERREEGVKLDKSKVHRGVDLRGRGVCSRLGGNTDDCEGITNYESDVGRDD